MSLLLLKTDLKISITDALVISAIAMSIIIGLLIIIMALVYLMTFTLKQFDAAKSKMDEKNIKGIKDIFKKKSNKVEVEEIADTPAGPLAPGSCGQIKLYNVADKDASMIMAIVANKLGKPINELRFISIKEIENK